MFCRKTGLSLPGAGFSVLLCPLSVGLVLLSLATGPTVRMAAAESAFIRVSDTRERITVSGTRATMGDAVECTQIRSDDGQLHGVHYLPTSVAIGDRVTVTGYLVNPTTCRGPVLFVEDLRLEGQ